MSSGSSAKVYTAGYWYLADIVFALCHRMDKLVGIMVGNKVAWTGNMTDGNISLAQPNLFGGTNSGGGVWGTLEIKSGLPTQAASGYLAARASGPQPAYRGVVTAIYHNGAICGVNPNPEPWSFLCESYASAWQPSLVTPKIDGEITGANPARIIYEVITSTDVDGATEWGMHIDASFVDSASFVAAAQTLYNEGLGISPIWESSVTPEDFILDIMNYIDGIVFVHPKTGLFTLKFISVRLSQKG